MCRRAFVFTSGDSPTAILFELCTESFAHLSSKLLAEVGSCFPPELENDPVFGECLKAFGDATHAVLELTYFDIDHRSNASVTALHRHQSADMRTHRLVFLRHTADFDGPATLDDAMELVSSANGAGYIVLRPDPSGPVGRSVIATPARLEGVLESVDVRKHVRSAVPEVISIFGHLKAVVGIPFIEQDGHIFSCAHAAAWMVHYAAVLRALVGRRPSSAFHTDLSGTLSQGRHYPSTGLTAWELSTLLEHFGLPTVLNSVVELSAYGRFADWFDRPSIFDLSKTLENATGLTGKKYSDHRTRIQEIADADEGTTSEQAREILDDHMLFWVRENLTRTVCEYLNSGSPSIILRDFHALVVTGYLRARDFAPEHPFQSTKYTDSDVLAFICSDDQIGPYQLISVDEILHGFTNDPSQTFLLVPLPQGVWAQAGDAETFGALAFRSAISSCLSAIEHVENEAILTPSAGDGSDQKAFLADLNVLVDLGTHSEKDSLSLRSYVVPSTDFKNGFADRCQLDPVAVAQVRLADLPRFVWVVEVMRRELREQKKSSVVGEVVMDATDVSLNSTKALITHFVGAIQVRGKDGPGKWNITGATELYRSGRYHDSKDWNVGPLATTARLKMAEA